MDSAVCLIESVIHVLFWQEYRPSSLQYPQEFIRLDTAPVTSEHSIVLYKLTKINVEFSRLITLYELLFLSSDIYYYIIMLAASSGKCTVTVQRLSVCLSVCPVFFLMLTGHAEHTQRDSPGVARDVARVHFGCVAQW